MIHRRRIIMNIARRVLNDFCTMYVFQPTSRTEGEMDYSLPLRPTISGSSVNKRPFIGKLMKHTFIFKTEQEIVYPYCKAQSKQKSGWDQEQVQNAKNCRNV